MRLVRRTWVLVLLFGATAMSGCGEGGLARGLREAGVRDTPDEFMVLPTRPLEMPPDLTALPPPVTGAANRVDYRPRAEAVAGLTGQTGAAGVTAAPGLVARAGAAESAIRARLANEDMAYRQNNRPRIVERLFSRDRDALVYRGMILDPRYEFERLRAQGVQVPAAPPTSAGE